MTIKTGKGVVRGEFDKELVDLDFGRMLLEISHHQILKIRHYINGWEIDVFEEPLEGIIIAEREMRSVDESVQVPDFFEKYREVTDSLTNLHLARLATDLKGLGAPALPFVSEGLLSSIPCIAITGGPCSGKTSIMSILKSELPDLHFVPEVASIIIGQVGILPSRNPVQNRAFQRAVYRVGKIFRITSTEFAIAQKKKAVVLDRGEADGAAYFDGGIPEFEAVLGTSIDAEYSNVDMPICLGVPSRGIYEQNKMNNPARSESYEEAVRLGERVRSAWERHPKFKFVPGETSWESKVNTVRELVGSLLKTKRSN